MNLKSKSVLICILFLFVLFLADRFIFTSNDVVVQPPAISNDLNKIKSCPLLATEYLQTHNFNQPGMNMLPKVFFNERFKICFLKIELTSKFLFHYELFDLTNGFNVASYRGEGDGDEGEEPITKECVIHGTKDIPCKDLTDFERVMNNFTK